MCFPPVNSTDTAAKHVVDKDLKTTDAGQNILSADPYP